MMELLYIVIILAYISLGLELSLAHVPSVASNVSIWTSKDPVAKSYSEKFSWVFTLSPVYKVLIFWLPLVGVYFVFLLPFLVMFSNADAFPPRVFQTSDLSLLLAIFLIVSGRIITLGAVLTIRKNNRQENESFTLHTGSVFSKSRNPTQLGMYIFYIGIFFGMPSLWLLVGLIYYVAYMHVKINMEEDFLKNKYGGDYENYFNNTRRYL